MANTIPGGYYLGADGNPHDANGKPLPKAAPSVTVETVAPPPAEPAAIPPDAPSEPAPVETATKGKTKSKAK